MIVAMVISVVLLWALFGQLTRLTSEEPAKLTYAELLEQADNGRVTEIKITNGTGDITGKYKPTEAANPKSFKTTGPDQVIDSDIQALRDKGVDIKFSTPQANVWLGLLGWVIPIGAMVLIFVWFSRRAQGQMSGIMSIGQSRAKHHQPEKPQTTFADVAGYEGVKREIAEVVDFLKMPTKFKAIGARIPKGVLLVGPPGTGKTLLARAVAGEAGVPFMSVSGSDFMEMFVGVGASRVRDMFQTARKQSPCIIFIDEIDSIGRKRGAGLGGGHDEREQTLNQMLAEMDGFETSEGIVVMAATNRPDILDPALLRPGRFDRQIVVPLPDLEERLPILQVHTQGKKLGADVDLQVIARGTPGMSGADLANLINEAALIAVRRGSTTIDAQDLDAARDRVMMGQRRESLALSDEERNRVAHHEAGHALLAHLLPHADPVHKVTILPTGMALGVTQFLPEEDRHIHSQNHIEDRLAVALGGRCAEILVFSDFSTGASNDLVRATELAQAMVREWGMSKRVGPMAWASRGMVFLGDDLVQSRDYSDETSRVIDEETEKILRDQEARALQVLSENLGALKSLAQALIDNEVVSGTDIDSIMAGTFEPSTPKGSDHSAAEPATTSP